MAKAIDATIVQEHIANMPGLNTQALSRADLLLLLREDNLSQHESLLQLLGYSAQAEPEPKPETENDSNRIEDIAEPPDSEPERIVRPSESRKGFYGLTHLSPVGQASPTKEAQSLPPQPTIGIERVSTQGFEAERPIPLVTWRRLWPALRNALAQWRQSQSLHMSQMLKQMSRGVPIHYLPYRQRLGWASQGEILFDDNPRLQPLIHDMNYVAERLQGTVPSGVQIHRLTTAEDGRLSIEQWLQHEHRPELTVQDYSLKALPVILVSDLGCYDLSHQATEHWLQRGKQWRVLGVRPTVLIPCPPDLWNPSLRAYYHCVYWDAGVALNIVPPLKPAHGHPPRVEWLRGSASNTESLNLNMPQAYETTQRVLALLSPLIGVEASVLRHIRMLLTDQQSIFKHYGIALEIWAWYHPQMISGAMSLQFSDAARIKYRQLFADTLVGFSATHQQAILQQLLQAHSHLHEMLWYEEVSIIGDLIQSDNEALAKQQGLAGFTPTQQQLFAHVQARIQYLAEQLKIANQQQEKSKNKAGVAQQTLEKNLDMSAQDLASYARRHSQRQMERTSFWQQQVAYCDLWIASLRETDIAAIGQAKKAIPSGFPLDKIAPLLTSAIEAKTRNLSLIQRGSVDLVLDLNAIDQAPNDFLVAQQVLLQRDVQHTLVDIEQWTDSATTYHRTLRTIPLDEPLSLGDIVNQDNVRLETDGFTAELRHYSKPIWAESIAKQAGQFIATVSRKHYPALREEGLTLHWVNPGAYTFTNAQGQTQQWWMPTGQFWDEQDIAENFELDPKTQQPVKIKTPVWAQHIGCDDYGLYAEVDIFGVTQTFRFILPGEFVMGSPQQETGRNIYRENKEFFNVLANVDYDAERRYQAVITKGFWLAETACTQALWQAVMEENSSGFQGDDRPVEQVSWEDIQIFIQRIQQRYPDLKPSLPSEAQWEYACRAGTQTPYFFGDDITQEQPHFDQESDVGAAEVNAKPANAWGLYQMHGNVWEWCADRFGPYPDGFSVDPIGPQEPEFTARVLRGGSWHDGNADFLRSAYRFHNVPDYRFGNVGFRLARG